MGSLTFILFTVVFYNSSLTHVNIVMLQLRKSKIQRLGKVRKLLSLRKLSMYPYTYHIPLFHAPFMEAGILAPSKPSGEQAELVSLQFLHQPSHRDVLIYPAMLSILSVIWFVSTISLPSRTPFHFPFSKDNYITSLRDEQYIYFPFKGGWHF